METLAFVLRKKRECQLERGRRKTTYEEER